MLIVETILFGTGRLRGSYYRRCYQEYTDKNKVAKAEQSLHFSEENFGQEPRIASPPKRICRSQVSTFDLNRYAIRQKDKILKLEGQPLTLNVSEFGSTSLTTAGQIRNDTRLLLHINNQDTNAIKIKYHRSCYKEYVR